MHVLLPMLLFILKTKCIYCDTTHILHICQMLVILSDPTLNLVRTQWLKNPHKCAIKEGLKPYISEYHRFWIGIFVLIQLTADWHTLATTYHTSELRISYEILHYSAFSKLMVHMFELE